MADHIQLSELLVTRLKKTSSNLKGWLYRSGVAFEPLRWLMRLSRLRKTRWSDITVVIVNWNTLPYLRVTLEAIRRHSPADTRILVVDNGSVDGSREYLACEARVRAVLIPRNLGHPVAMDLGFLLARSTYVVALDVDAFPISDEWLDVLLTPLREGYEVSGATTHEDIIHPCCLAMTSKRFVERRHTFGVRQWTEHGLVDTGELISLREDRRFTLPRTQVVGPYEIGSVFGDVVYHNFYSARGNADGLYPIPEHEEEAGVRAIADRAWRDAISRYQLG